MLFSLYKPQFFIWMVAGAEDNVSFITKIWLEYHNQRKQNYKRERGKEGERENDLTYPMIHHGEGNNLMAKRSWALNKKHKSIKHTYRREGNSTAEHKKIKIK
jgi:hypothetical protein